MKDSEIIFLLLIFGIFFSSCSTGPEFDRNNPYDRDSTIDTLGVKQFPPPKSGKYTFTASGLKLNVYRNSLGSGETTILRKNGASGFEILDTLILQTNPARSHDFIDSEIKKAEDIGYPLIYGIKTNSTGEINFVEVDFGSIKNITQSVTKESVTVSWQDSVYLNDGFRVIRNQEDEFFEVTDISPAQPTFQIPNTKDNLNSKYLIIPYKIHRDEKTNADTTNYFPIPSLPTDLDFEIINTETIKLSWKDRSIIETGYQVVDSETNENFYLPADKESILIEKDLSSNKNYNFTIYALFNDRQSAPTSIDTTLPDFPYPKITNLKHIDDTSFEIHFEDRVDFERQIHFTFDGNTHYKTKNSTGFIIVSVPTEYEPSQINFSADLSYGQYGNRSISLSIRPSLELMKELKLAPDSNPKKIDLRTIGNILTYTTTNKIFSVDLSLLKSQPRQIAQLPANISLLRLSNDNSVAYANTEDGYHYLVNMENGEREILDGVTEIIYDVSFIEDDTKVAMSTNKGLLVYSLESNQSSEINNFNSTAELEFYGDASKTRLLVLDRKNYKVHFFNTSSGFKYYNTLTLNENEINGYSSELTNVSHLNSRNNVVGYEVGGGVEFEINKPDCSLGWSDFACLNQVYDPYYGFESTSSWDRNAYFQILDDDIRIVSTDNFLRVIHRTYAGNIHVIKRDPSNVSMFKINYDNKLLTEFHKETKSLLLYDVSKKWSLTNFGTHMDFVWPSN